MVEYLFPELEPKEPTIGPSEMNSRKEQVSSTPEMVAHREAKLRFDQYCSECDASAGTPCVHKRASYRQ